MSALKKKRGTRGVRRPRAGVSHDRLIEAAAGIADREGLGAVTLARLADEMGVRSPSLYAHVDGLGAVLLALKVRALTEQLARVQRACVGRARGEAVRALCDALRRFGHEHPGQFWAAVRIDATDPPAARALADETLGLVLAVLAGYGLAGDVALHATRVVRAATHGFISLELAGGFGLPLEVDESWRRMIDQLERALESMAQPP